MSPNGNDANAGSLQAPWRTLQKASNNSASGDLIYVRAGRYAAFSVKTHSGTSAHPIIFTGYPGDPRPVVDGGQTATFTVTANNANWIVFDRLDVTGGHGPAQWGGGFGILSSSHISVSRSSIHDNLAFGVLAYYSSYSSIADNDMAHNAVAVTLKHDAGGSIVENNAIHNQDRMMVNTPGGNDDAGGEGIAVVRSTGQVTIRGNQLWANRAVSYDFGYDGGAFSIYASSNVTFADNVTWDSQNVLETGTDSGVPCANNTFVRNVAFNPNPNTRNVGVMLRCADNMLIANNTFVDLTDWSILISFASQSWNGTIEGLTIENNIIKMNGQGTAFSIASVIPTSVRIDYNLVYNPGGNIGYVAGKGSTTSLSTFASWTGYQRSGVQASPGFVDPAAANYRLSSVSAAIDQAMLIAPWTDGYTALAPDIGRYER